MESASLSTVFGHAICPGMSSECPFGARRPYQVMVRGTGFTLIANSGWSSVIVIRWNLRKGSFMACCRFHGHRTLGWCEATGTSLFRLSTLLSCPRDCARPIGWLDARWISPRLRWRLFRPDVGDAETKTVHNWNWF